MASGSGESSWTLPVYQGSDGRAASRDTSLLALSHGMFFSAAILIQWIAR
jgi:hypothetical protein